MCVDCHDEYERHADAFKKQLAAQYGVSLQGVGWYSDRELAKVIMYAKTLRNHGDKIPAAKKQTLIEPLRVYFKKDDITDEDLVYAAGLDSNVFTEEYAQHGELIVKMVGDIEEFVKTWRQHFLNSMNPKHLPAFWDVNRSIYRQNQPGFAFTTA